MVRSTGQDPIRHAKTSGAVGVGKVAMSDLVSNLQKKPTVGPGAALAADNPPHSEASGTNEHCPLSLTGAGVTELETTQGAQPEKTARPEDFTILESVLVSRLGISREILREKRKLGTEGEHWSWIGGNRVCWSAAGVVWLENALRGPRNDRGADPSPGSILASNGQDAHAAREEQAIKDLRVLRTFMNPRLLLATDGVAVFRVRVRNSRNFVPRMTIPCRRIQADLWELARACPRFRGKW